MLNPVGEKTRGKRLFGMMPLLRHLAHFFYYRESSTEAAAAHFAARCRLRTTRRISRCGSKARRYHTLNRDWKLISRPAGMAR